MRVSVNRPMLTLGAAFFLSVACRAQQFSERDRFVETERDAILMPQPEFVAPGDVMAAEWSPDARSVLLVRADPPPIGALLAGRPPSFETQLQLWTREGRKLQLLWRTVLSSPAAYSMSWLAKTQVALVTLEGPLVPPAAAPREPEEPARNFWLFRVDTRTRQIRALAKVTGGTAISVSPTQPFALVTVGETNESRVLRSDGTFSAPIRLPDKRVAVNPEWSADGRAILVQGIIPDGTDRKPAPRYRIDAATMAISIQEQPEPPQARQSPPFEWSVKQGRAALADGNVRAPVRPLWLVSSFDGPHRQALIAADTMWGTLAPTGDAVLYATEGGAWVMPLVHVDRAKFNEARNAALRQTVQSNAKQLGLAAIMYAQDYDEILPGAHQDIQNILQPYCKNEKLFNGFVYTFGGGAIKDIPNTKTQELGFIPGPGGRALLYADGHVEWKADTPPAPR